MLLTKMIALALHNNSSHILLDNLVTQHKTSFKIQSIEFPKQSKTSYKQNIVIVNSTIVSTIKMSPLKPFLNKC